MYVHQHLVWMSTTLLAASRFLTQPRIPGCTFPRDPRPSRASNQPLSCGGSDVSALQKLVTRPLRLRDFQDILHRALLGVVQDQHGQVLLVHTNIANTKVGKQGFRCLWVSGRNSQNIGRVGPNLKIPTKAVPRDVASSSACQRLSPRRT